MTSSDNKSTNVVEKRIIKSVKRLADAYENVYDKTKGRKSIELYGSGVKLGDIERVKNAFQRSKIDQEISRNIHFICYRTVGKVHKRNSDIRKFNGFNIEDENEIKKRVSIAEKLKMSNLKLICDLFNISITGKQKKDISISLVDYLKCPFETGSITFRTKTLRYKTRKKSAPRKKRKEKNSADVGLQENASDTSSDSLSDSDHEQIILPKTKRLEKRNVDDEGEFNEALYTGKECFEKIEDFTEKEVLTKSNESERKVCEKNTEESVEKKFKIYEMECDKDVPEITLNKDIKIVKIDQEVDEVPKSKSGVNNNGNMAKRERGTSEIMKRKLGSDKGDTSKMKKARDKKIKGRIKVGPVEKTKRKFNLSDEHLKSTILTILKDADLSTITLNIVCDKVIAQFPITDLGPQRQYIKELAKKVIDEN